MYETDPIPHCIQPQAPLVAAGRHLIVRMLLVVVDLLQIAVTMTLDLDRMRIMTNFSMLMMMMGRMLKTLDLKMDQQVFEEYYPVLTVTRPPLILMMRHLEIPAVVIVTEETIGNTNLRTWMFIAVIVAMIEH